MSGEIWKDVESFTGSYQVSSLGNVRSLTRTRENGRVYPSQEIKIQPHPNGYRQVHLQVPGRRRKYFIHRLVAFHFLEIVPGKDYINHIDKDRTNNEFTNLEFMTQKENCHHRDNHTSDNEHNAHIPF